MGKAMLPKHIIKFVIIKLKKKTLNNSHFSHEYLPTFAYYSRMKNTASIAMASSEFRTKRYLIWFLLCLFTRFEYPAFPTFFPLSSPDCLQSSKFLKNPSDIYWLRSVVPILHFEFTDTVKDS